MESDTHAIESRSLLEQVVLLSVAHLHRASETPVQTPDVCRTCRRRVLDEERAVVGTVGEADVMRSLYRLEDEGLVEEIDTARGSPVGKGRPAYTLAVDPEDVYDGVDDDLFDGVVG